MSITLNHIGLVVKDASESAKLLGVLGFRQVTRPEPDPIQRVKACFLAATEGTGPHIELLEPTDEDSPVAGFLAKRGGGLHHMCFEVDDIEDATRELEQKGFQLVSSPVECMGYDQSFELEQTRIAFFMLPNKLLIELLQKGKEAGTG
jgi:methylmalonyl-CoA/ethylmalonyl-CoA epimerase